MTNEERQDSEFSRFLDPGEKILYTGRAHTGSILRSSLAILSPLLGWWLNKKEPLETWRLAITNRRVLLAEGSKERSFSYDQLSGLQLVRSSGVNRTLLTRTAEGAETKIGLPAARNSYTELEEALRKAAPQFASG